MSLIQRQRSEPERMNRAEPVDTVKKTGVRKTPKMVTPSIPLKTVVPSVRRISAPAPGGQDQRDDAEDEGQRRHHDRPEPQLAGVECRLMGGFALLALDLGELDDQDRVLARQTHQHHEADLREDIDVLRKQIHADDRAEQTHRHHENHRQRHRPAFVLCRQYKEDHHDGEPENDHGGVARFAFEESELGPFGLHRGEQCSSLREHQRCPSPRRSWFPARRHH